jgi:hypothetical protein
MSDITLSLIIILIAAVVTALLFLFVGKRKKKKEQALADYCRARGYTFTRTKEALGVEVRVESDAFLLASSMKSPQRLNEPRGSSQWLKETTWTARGRSGELPGFILGSVSAGGDWGTLPDWIRNAAVQKLATETGLTLNPARARPVRTKGKARFLLFEETPGEGSAILQRLGPLLDSWPEQFDLVVSSGPQGLLIRVVGLFIESISRLEHMLRLGEACAE